jgi:hypothetical protein
VPAPPPECALGIEDVSVEPHVRVAEPVGSPSGVAQDLEGRRTVTPGVLDQGQSTGGHSLPARVAELAGPREGLLEQHRRSLGIASGQLDLAAHGLWPGEERQPVVTGRHRQRRVQVLGRRLELSE